MNQTFRKPATRSKTPEPVGSRRDAIVRAVIPASAQPSSRQPLSNRVAKSENDLSAQRKLMKPKETLSKQDQLALSYNTYLQSCLMAAYNAEINEKKEQKVINIMESQQLELIALDEENNFMDMALMKIQLYKEMKEKTRKKTEFCKKIIDSINEQVLDNQIKTIENCITKSLLKNFELPKTKEDEELVLDQLRKISELLNTIPEMKNIVQPLTNVCSSLIQVQELNDRIEKLKKESLNKLKLAENLLYDEFYLKTKMNESKEWNVTDSEKNCRKSNS